MTKLHRLDCFVITRCRHLQDKLWNVFLLKSSSFAKNSWITRRFRLSSVTDNENENNNSRWWPHLQHRYSQGQCKSSPGTYDESKPIRECALQGTAGISTSISQHWHLCGLAFLKPFCSKNSMPGCFWQYIATKSGKHKNSLSETPKFTQNTQNKWGRNIFVVFNSTCTQTVA